MGIILKMFKKKQKKNVATEKFRISRRRLDSILANTFARYYTMIFIACRFQKQKHTKQTKNTFHTMLVYKNTAVARKSLVNANIHAKG